MPGKCQKAFFLSFGIFSVGVDLRGFLKAVFAAARQK